MRRKLVKQGPSTITVSLPKDWVERFSLKTGDEIDLAEIGEGLVISPIQQKRNEKPINYDFNPIGPGFVHSMIVSMYRSGLRDISISNVSSEQLSQIDQIVNSTIGFQIFKSNEKTIQLIDLGISDENSLIKAEQQIFWKLLDLIDAILSDSVSEKRINELDFEINKLSFFIQRNIASKFSSSSNNFLIYEKVSALENLGDSLKEYRKFMGKSDNNKIQLKEYSSILDSLRASQNKSSLNELSKIHERILSILNKLSGNKKRDNESKLVDILILKNLKQILETTLCLNIKNYSIS